MITVPDEMKIIQSNFPLIVTKIKSVKGYFPTVTITQEDTYKQDQKTNEEYEKDLKHTYETLELNVKASNFLREQDISNVKTKLFKVEYTYENKYFVSLINIFPFNDKTHYITTINIINGKSTLEDFLKFQENFLKNISLKHEDESPKTIEDYTASNILIGFVFLLAGFLLYRNKNKSKHTLQ